MIGLKPLVGPIRCAVQSILGSSPLFCGPADAAGNKKAPSLSWSWEELSVPSARLDGSISSDTLILAPHCLFFPGDEIQLERRATGRIVTTPSKQPGLVPSKKKTAHDDFFFCLSHLLREHKAGWVAGRRGGPPPRPPSLSAGTPPERRWSEV